MINHIGSSSAAFKKVVGSSGLNLIVADRTDASADTDTRNGAGKTSFVELVHFLLGANCDTKSIFRSLELVEDTFEMELELPDQSEGRQSGLEAFRARRSGGSPNDVFVSWRGKDGWAEEGKVNLASYKASLREALYGLHSDDIGPSARLLLSYAARRQNDGGFSEAFRINPAQSTGSEQVAVSFLLGLDWIIASEWEKVREREKATSSLKKALKRGDLGTPLGDPGELRSELVRTRARANRLRDQLHAFRVVDQYRDAEAEASALTRAIRDGEDRNLLDQAWLLDLKAALRDEEPPDLGDVEAMYASAGIEIPDLALRTFEEVRAFHESVINNRRAYLEGEVAKVEDGLAARDAQMRREDARRAELMTVLSSGGALESYSQLQTELARLDARVAAVAERYEQAVQLDSTQTELKIERQQLLERLQQDHHERDAKLVTAIETFGRLSEYLYGDDGAGSLVVEETANGPRFDVRIPGEKSKGITNMQIFCVDVMLTQLCATAGVGPGFLIHDSHLFDGVDSRQVARALSLAATSSREYGYQHIITLNSDTIEMVSSDFDASPYVLPVPLTDAKEDGGLFGVRFN